jgi:ribosomal protein L44E
MEAGRETSKETRKETRRRYSQKHEDFGSATRPDQAKYRVASVSERMIGPQHLKTAI